MLYKKIALLLCYCILCSYNAIAQSPTSIFEIARTGSLTDIQQLYQTNPTQIDSINSMGYTPLILACYRGNTEVASFLASHTQKIDYVSTNGTALAATVYKGDVATAKLLLDHKANPSMPDGNGTTPIVYAIQFQNQELVKLLLAYGANKTIKDHTGKTPFEYAVETGNPTIIHLLKT